MASESTTFKLANNGQAFTLELDTPLIREVRKELDIDLVAADMSGEAKAASDIATLVDVLWILCREQAEKNGISADVFGRGIKGDSWEAAVLALRRAIAFFSPSSSRSIRLAQIAAEERLQRAGAAAALAKMTDEKAMKAIEDRITAEVDRAMSNLMTPATVAKN